MHLAEGGQVDWNDFENVFLLFFSVPEYVKGYVKKLGFIDFQGLLIGNLFTSLC